MYRSTTTLSLASHILFAFVLIKKFADTTTHHTAVQFLLIKNILIVLILNLNFKLTCTMTASN